MKPEEFERLKELCAKEGFIVSRGEEIPGDTILVEVYRDPWEGVEFAECVNDQFLKGSIQTGKVYKLREVDVKGAIGSTSFLGAIAKNKFKPSTEKAYVDQLKNEAMKRFGEIKVGDRFHTVFDGETFMIDDDYGFNYRKSDDTFFYSGWSIYQAGKWAKKLPERIKVTYDNSSRNLMTQDNLDVEFLFSDPVEFNEAAVCNFLSYQLEKFLNGEIEKEVGNG